MKRYNILNNALGWATFVVAAVTYLLTLEPTASFWDCPEFISQGYKLEIGHPPGNPIFMLTARFFVNFVSDPSHVAVAVNTMSALLSAATILLLFWTITHLVKRLVVADDAATVGPMQMLVIFGSALCGSLVYTWSDTFWFSAVEGEVYAYSSFCTALVFWLILKWESRADEPHSDRYLVLIAYVIGISIAVHLLNLLCIPAIVLVFYYKKWKNPDGRGSLLALLVSFAIVAFILYGLVPGYIEMAEYFELFCVNTLGMGYNSGAFIYAVIAFAVMIWTVVELYRQKSAGRMRLAFFLTLSVSGIPFIGYSWWLSVAIIAAMLWLIYRYFRKVPVRIFTVAALSILVIFIGYSSYALLLIRSSAYTPMNQNAPDNVFALSSYLNREQYGERPLFYGQTFNSSIVYEVGGDGVPHAVKKNGPRLWGKAVKASPDDPDRYEAYGTKIDYELTPELNMLFPRMYSSAHSEAYREWTGMTGTLVETTSYVDAQGNPLGDKQMKVKPTFLENLRYFFNYQLNHMYWRYFMWNFAGRQNDIQGNGEVTHGNWVSGIPLIDNLRLGDQSLLPEDLGSGNKGHNVFFMLPLLLGIIGLLWQAFTSRRGIEQFWVVFFLFFMTGIAIVIYLNQVPNQPRERDYAFAGSFYAFAIWVGMGVAGLWRLIAGMADARAAAATRRRLEWAGAGVGALLGLLVPLQMVSQTWDDHDRSGRYACRDFGMNYLSSLDPDAIIFTNGDNDTFPLWYAQEVEGYRTDVRVVNLSYLTTDWYVDQMRHPFYDAKAIPMLATPDVYAHDKRQFTYFINPDTTRVAALASLKEAYREDSKNATYGLYEMRHPNMYIPLDADALVAAGRIGENERGRVAPALDLNQTDNAEGGLRLSSLIAIDMLATNAQSGWQRPFYFAMTVPEEYYLGLQPYMRSTGMAYEVGGIRDPQSVRGQIGVNTDKAYDNIVNRFRWGGLDKAESADDIYLDETVRRMVTSTRSTMLDLATALYNEGVTADAYFSADSLAYSPEVRDSIRTYIAGRYDRAAEVMDLMTEKMPEYVAPYGIQIGYQAADIYGRLGAATGNEELTDKAIGIVEREIDLYKQYMIYIQSLPPTKFASLTRLDRYIFDTYFMSLVQLYVSLGAEPTELLKDLAAQGVDFNRYYRNHPELAGGDDDGQ